METEATKQEEAKVIQMNPKVEEPQPTAKQESKEEEPVPIAHIPHVENTYTFSFNEMTQIKAALAPFEFAIALLNSTKHRVDNQQGNQVPVFEQDVVRTKDANGNEQTNLKDAVKFWEKHTKLKGNAMKIENGQLKTNEVYTDLEK